MQNEPKNVTQQTYKQDKLNIKQITKKPDKPTINKN
jgi:hypothetical protein